MGCKNQSLQGWVCPSLWVAKIEKNHLSAPTFPPSHPRPTLFIFPCTEYFISKESDTFIRIKLSRLMWSSYTLAKDHMEPKTAIRSVCQCVTTRFLSQRQTLDTNSSWKGKVHISPWLQRCQSGAPSSCCLWAWCKRTHHSKESEEEKKKTFIVSRKSTRERRGTRFLVSLSSYNLK